MRFLRSSRATLESTYRTAGKALSLLTLEVRGLHAAAYILAASSLFSSLLALLRDRLLAHVFGAGAELDLYYAAFRLPDLVFIGIGALVSAYMLIPELSRRSEEGQKQYIDTIVAGFSLLIALVAGVVAVFAPRILALFFSSLSGDLEMLTLLTRIVLLQAIFLGFSNIAAAITQFRHRYALYALSPVVYNLGIIFGAYVLYPRFGLVGLVSGVVFGAALHLLIQVPSIVADGFVRHIPRVREPLALWDTVSLSVPRALALSMNQLAFFGLFSLASALSAGSISVFMFAYNLASVPLSVIGASYATAAFPTLALYFSRGSSDEYLAYVAVAARQILFWSMPVIAVMIVLRAHIVRVVLGTGAFDWTDTRLTAAALALLVLSLAAQGFLLLLMRAFYASGRTLLPFVTSAVTAGLTIGLSLMFLGRLEDPESFRMIESFLRVEDVAGTHLLALASAYSLANLIGAVFLIGYFEYYTRGFVASINRAWWESLIAALAGGAAAYVMLNIIGDITFSSTLISVLLKAVVAGGSGLGASALSYYLLGSKEYAENTQALHKRLWRQAEPIASSEQTT